MQALYSQLLLNLGLERESGHKSEAVRERTNNCDVKQSVCTVSFFVQYLHADVGLDVNGHYGSKQLYPEKCAR